MRETDEQKPGGIARTVGGTAALAATLFRLAAGIVAVACLGYVVKDRLQGTKKKKNSCSPPSQGKRH